jgi:hypothetical protein
LEALVLRSLWPGASLPPVIVPKAVVGEYAGGVLSAAVLAMRGAPFGAILAFGTPDSDLMIAPHDGGSLPQPRRLLVSSLASGGAAAWAVLERV